MMKTIGVSRRLLLAGGTVALAAPAVVRSARAATTTFRLSTSFPNDPKFSTARIWYDLFLPRLKDAAGDQIAIQFFPDNQLGQEADVANQVKLGVVDAMLVGHVDLDQPRPRIRRASTSATCSRTSSISGGPARRRRGPRSAICSRRRPAPASPPGAATSALATS